MKKNILLFGLTLILPQLYFAGCGSGVVLMSLIGANIWTSH